MSSKRNRNRKAWERRRKAKRPSAAKRNLAPTIRRPSELDQVGVLITEPQLGLEPTDLAGLRRVAARLPFETSMSLIARLAGLVEDKLRDATRQLAIAESFFGSCALVERYRTIMEKDKHAVIFGPQSLYSLMRVLVDEAQDAAITHQLTDAERLALFEAVVASNSITERGIDLTGPGLDDLLAYELQVGNYYSRPAWMEEMVRARELYRLAVADQALAQSSDFVPVGEWTERRGLTAQEQWQLGFGLGSLANAWDGDRHPHVPEAVATDFLRRAGLTDRQESALSLVAADRLSMQRAFRDLEAAGKRLIWELRPFNTYPFLRLSDGGGLLLLGRPWMLSWLSEGFHYRAMRIAQSEDAESTRDRPQHVQRYTAFMGQVFERYCLGLAKGALHPPISVMGEQPYGRKGASKTSDVAVHQGDDLILFEANARRVSAEPLVAGDPMDASVELTKLLVKKVNQLGVVIGALLADRATLPDVDVPGLRRIFPVVVAGGRLWQTKTLYDYIDRTRDAEKCKSLGDKRVRPLQVLDPSEYELLLALAREGHGIGELLERKTSGPYRYRDLAVWLSEDPRAPSRPARLPAIERAFGEMTTEVVRLFDQAVTG